MSNSLDSEHFNTVSNSVSNTPVNPLTPPDLQLEPAAVLKEVATTSASAMAPQVPSDSVSELDAKVNAFMDALESNQPGSPTFAAQADAVRSMGDADIRKAAETSNRLLETPIREMNEGGVSNGSKVSTAMLELRKTVEELDPNSQSKSKKILGIIPRRNKMTEYFRKYENSQQQLNAILHALRSGQDELTKDNVSLQLEKQTLWQTMARLNQYVYIAEQLDHKLTDKIAQLQSTDPEKAKTLTEDVLFYVRQKHTDLLTQLAVSVQGYLAIDVVIKNNLELIKGVDRASTTTVSALRTAVVVSQALGNQKLVLEQITALNTTTSNLIQNTSEMLKNNSATIQEQAASSTINMAQLQAAFTNIYETIDTIDTFKMQAVENMGQSIKVLEAEVIKSRQYLERIQNKELESVQGSDLTIENLADNAGVQILPPASNPQAKI